ncbi:MAG: Pyruvate phosphate dikinase, AMP/ATP-binding domain, partial [Agromyces sp.]|nr:Pyruvate phosphate dikinase, AMP/ATP-binding domain [Agromyces sp.]
MTGSRNATPDPRPDPTPFLLGDEPDALVVERVGAKAATLAELRRAGFRVPPGVAVPIDAFAP